MLSLHTLCLSIITAASATLLVALAAIGGELMISATCNRPQQRPSPSTVLEVTCQERARDEAYLAPGLL